jgi:anhydro-N-acetylmuramic acid kinase
LSIDASLQNKVYGYLGLDVNTTAREGARMPVHPNNRIVVGTMTGTSIDGLDVAAIRVTGHGLEQSVQLLGHDHTPLGSLGAPLRDLADQVPATAGEIARLAHDFGRLHAETIRALLERCSVSPDLIAVHGQTVFHAPPFSWALLDPAPLLEAFDCSVVTNLRVNDLAEAGQGAPITPIADWVLFRSERPRAIVNLGGFCNVSHLPAAAQGPATLRGRDVCACNHPLDAEARRSLDQPMDRDGASALAGTVDPAISDRLGKRLAAPEAGAPRSLGTGEEMHELLAELERLEHPPDRLATLADAIAGAIAAEIEPAEEVLFFGGGIRNKALHAAFARHLPAHDLEPAPPEIDVHAREATAIGVLGALAMDGVGITLPSVTGRRTAQRHLDGAWHLAIPGDFTEPLPEVNIRP